MVNKPDLLDVLGVILGWCVYGKLSGDRSQEIPRMRIKSDLLLSMADPLMAAPGISLLRLHPSWSSDLHMEALDGEEWL